MRRLAWCAAFLGLIASSGCGDDVARVNTDGGGGISGSDGGMDAPMCSALITNPMTGAALTASNDKDGKCDNGFQIDVRVAVVGVPDGTTVSLLAGAAPAGTATVTGGQAQFLNTQLPSQGTVALTAQVAGRCQG